MFYHPIMEAKSEDPIQTVGCINVVIYSDLIYSYGSFPHSLFRGWKRRI